MPAPLRLWLRHESRATERRAPLVPEDAARLVGEGVEITVEESPQRVFPIAAYVRAGCATAPAGSWVEAPEDHYVLGVKELPAEPRELRHRHIYFGHAYKGQTGAGDLLARFTAGGGTLLDLEYLVDDDGRRLVAFGYWAGYIGAALAVLHRRGTLATPLRPLDRPGWEALLRAGVDGDGPRPDGGGGPALVIGARGRGGRGACDALEAAGVTPVRWGVTQTRVLDRAALLSYDLLVNAVLVTRPVPPFLTPADLDSPGRRLSVVADVTCDVHSECNVLPVYDAVTDWAEPARRLRDGDRPLDVIAVDNLPALVPVESSRAFSAELWPQLLRLNDGAGAWVRCRRAFAAAVVAVVDESPSRSPGPPP
ncbi:saccharopine dehydrogenase [Streptomyces sp. NPDC002643]